MGLRSGNLQDGNGLTIGPTGRSGAKLFVMKFPKKLKDDFLFDRKFNELQWASALGNLALTLLNNKVPARAIVNEEATQLRPAPASLAKSGDAAGLIP